MVLGPLADYVVEKLTLDFPQQFQRCKINTMRTTKEAIEQGLQSNAIADYRRRGSVYECTTIQAINEARVSFLLNLLIIKQEISNKLYFS